MINISQELKNAFLADGINKNITIEFDNDTDFSRVNFLNSFVANAITTATGTDFTIGNGRRFGDSYTAESPFNVYWPQAKRCVITYQLKITEWSSSTGTTPTYIKGVAQVQRRNGTYAYPGGSEILFADALAGYVTIRIAISNNSNCALIERPLILTFLDENKASYTNNEKGTITFAVTNVHINIGPSAPYMPYPDDYQAEYYGKDVANYVTEYPEIAPITNEQIDQESFELIECLDARVHPSYGIAGTASCIFTVVNNTDKLSGRRFMPYIGVDGINERIPLGKFLSFSEQNEGSRKVIKKTVEAYDQLLSFDGDVSEWFKAYNGSLSNIGYYGSSFLIDTLYRQRFETISDVFTQINVPLKKTFIANRKLTRVTEQPYNFIKHNFDPEVPPRIGVADGILYKRYWLEIPSTTTKTKFYKIKLNYSHSWIKSYVFDDPNYPLEYGKGDAPGYTLENGGILFQTIWGNVMVNEDSLFAIYVVQGTSQVSISIPYQYFITDKDGESHDVTLSYADSDICVEEYEISEFETMGNLDEVAEEIIGVTDVSTARDVLSLLLTKHYLKYDRNGNLALFNIPNAESISETILMNDYESCKRSDYTEYPFDYIPHDTLAMGMPWLECGDRIQIMFSESSLNTLIFQRDLRGIQRLTDEFEAVGVGMESSGVSGGGSSGGGSGNVLSVNGKTGDVVLTTNDLQNNSGFITASVANLVNYYTKSETYTQAEVDALISAISTMSFLVVQTLPTTNIKTNIIYLVPKSPSGTQNTYTEYINTTGTTSGWEKIGDTEIDLSNYYTKTEADTLLANKVDKVSGKGLSTNDYTTAEKTKLAGITEGADVTPPVFGSILIDDSDVLGPNYVLDMLKIKSGDNVNLDVDYINHQLVVNATDTTYEDATTSVHGLMSTSDKSKLNGIASGAEVNVQSDWNVSDSNSDAFIKNKPSNLVQDASYVHTDNNYTTTEKNKLAGIASGAEVNVQSDWNVSDASSDAFIKNKPTIPNVATKYDSSDATEATLADDDKVPFYDTSATARRNSTWANIKAKLKSYFDGLYLTLTNPTGSGSITMNPPSNYVAGSQSVSLGQHNNASGGQSVAMGYGNTASGDWSVAMGTENTASGETSVAIGNNNTVSDNWSVAIGDANVVTTNDSFVFGYGLVSHVDLQTIIGKYNNNKITSIFEIGNGTSVTRANALEIDTNNNLKVYGTITDGSGNVLSNKQEKLVSGTNIKTINSTSLVGSGNIAVQPTLVSGTNIKTINNQSILGSGNITISAGGATWGAIGGTLSDQTDLQTALDNKQAKLVSGTNIKTVGGTSLLGSGNIAVGLTPTVLWTNPSPTASFEAQVVTLSQSLSNFSFYDVIVRVSTSDDYYMTSGLMPIDKTGRITMALDRNYVRNVATQMGSGTVGTSFRFGPCTRYTTYGSTTTTNQNGYLVPYQIIGWK